MLKYKLLAFFIFTIVLLKNSDAQINFNKGSLYKYLKGVNASSLGADWQSGGFDDTNWASGNAPFRYGKGNGGTVLNDMRNSYSTLYLRATFNVQTADKIEKLKLNFNVDDGFVLWINGQELVRHNAPEILSNEGLAPEAFEYTNEQSILINLTNVILLEGDNQLAVQLFNTTLGSSDIYFDMAIEAEPKLPQLEYTGEGIEFSRKAGFYDNAFDLTITSSDQSCKIYYTIDGSNPAGSPTRKLADSPVLIRVDPAISSGRGHTPGFVVRCCLYKAGFEPTFPQSATYIFIENVKTQSAPGGEWPVPYLPNWNETRQYIDYGMASDVVNDSRYKNKISDALKSIPTFSISTDLENLFGDSEGIYVNAENKGLEWERECSIELIYPDSEEGFSVNAGLRIRGGNSAKGGKNPKHAFRLFFRDEYGTSKLKYPLFGSSGADEFDCFDLRCEQNYSWSMDGDPHNTFVKDIFCRDLQGLMGQPYSKGEYYHLYLNGMYWGLFQTDERPESSFASSYLGGDKDDYDVIKVTTQDWPYYDEATDGTMDSWEKVWNMCQSGFSNNEQYFRIEGKDINGERIDTATVWVDIDNLIDYMMVIFYSGNFDAPVSAWYSNDMPNNFFAIYNREDKSHGYKFVAHDSEHCMFVDNVNSKGIDENRVDIGSNGKMRITRLTDFNPQWLHYKLSDNSEYRLRFADRAAKYLSEGGILSPDKARNLFQKRANEIETAVIAESARWGDAKTYSYSLNKEDDWLPELENLYYNYFPYRTNIVIQQLIDEDLYSTIGIPDVLISNNKILSDNFVFNESQVFTIKNSSGYGELFYTLNGSDPRLVGGDIAESASSGGTQIEKEVNSTTILQVRIKNGTIWGPLKKVVFIKNNEDFSTLKVTELNYHPSELIIGTDTSDDKSLEFIEFKNTGTESLDLSGVKIDSAVTYVFPDNTILGQGEYYIIASKPNSFFKRYGKYPNGNFQGQFGNGGEYVLVSEKDGTEILSFTYSDKAPWPEEADGQGYTLTSVEENPTGDPNDYTYWKKSKYINGSPFINDEFVGGGIITNVPSNFDVFLYPNPTSNSINVNLRNSETKERTLISIYEMDGRKVYECSVTKSEIIELDNLGLNKGMLLLRAINGDQVLTKKFVYMP